MPQIACVDVGRAFTARQARATPSEPLAARGDHCTLTMPITGVIM